MNREEGGGFIYSVGEILPELNTGNMIIDPVPGNYRFRQVKGGGELNVLKYLN